MYHQRIKLNQIGMIALSLAILFCFIAIIKSFLFSAFITSYFIAVSIICDGLLLQMSHKKLEGIRLLILGALLFIITTFVMIYFIKL